MFLFLVFSPPAEPIITIWTISPSDALIECLNLCIFFNNGNTGYGYSYAEQD